MDTITANTVTYNTLFRRRAHRSSFPSPQPPKSHPLQVVIGVDPDFFYRSLFATFDAPKALDLAKEPPARFLNSAYILFTQSLPLEE